MRPQPVVPLRSDYRPKISHGRGWTRPHGDPATDLEKYLLATIASTVSLAEETARIQKQAAEALRTLASSRGEEEDISLGPGNIEQAVQRLNRIEDAIRALTSRPDGRRVSAGRHGLHQVPRQGRREAGPPADPLTAREETVLQMMRGPLSLSEIGRELHVSKNTIKSHTRAIYRKLGVAERSQAIRRARDLGIF
jgi:LuxR family transcriptional regulator, maltose regulon positive regulatory protein